MDVRKLTVCYGRGNYKQAPPQILLQEQAGFSAGDKITVKCQQGGSLSSQKTVQGQIQGIHIYPGK